MRIAYSETYKLVSISVPSGCGSEMAVILDFSPRTFGEGIERLPFSHHKGHLVRTMHLSAQIGTNIFACMCWPPRFHNSQHLFFLLFFGNPIRACEQVIGQGCWASTWKRCLHTLFSLFFFANCLLQTATPLPPRKYKSTSNLRTWTA